MHQMCIKSYGVIMLTMSSHQKEIEKTKDRMKKVLDAEKSQDSFPST